jgi:hypothetical protein
MLRTLLVAMAAYLSTGSQAPVQGKPDFSGNWTVVSGLESLGWGAERLVIKQAGSSVSIQVTKGNAVSLDVRSYRLDGTENRAESTDRSGVVTVQSSRVEWIADALAITTTVSSGSARWQDFEAYSFDDLSARRLVVMRIWSPSRMGVMGTSRVVYQRDSAQTP